MTGRNMRPTNEQYAKIAIFKAIEAQRAANQVSRELGNLKTVLMELSTTLDRLRAELREPRD